jgi:hypothetical protein
VGLEVVVAIVAKYDHTILMSLFLTVYNSLTLKPIIVEPLDLGTFELGVFGSMALTKKFSPFNWWVEHEQ